ncbi:ATP-sensitive inward rectifier potassium channel 12-like [Frankliniella occidentalis]|uniref:ATP-sensitive inward rectifier potassium channel 12-like n=1 Tax=Frankliniella occidentalis TaxID=133901 RepID=A0A6J1THB6_FRAOC|nr:ATP-sensitive inward rectifier potassium channel 12-like [Frankliniella occidentalis]
MDGSGEGRAEDVSSPLTKKHKTAISQRRHSNGRRLVGKAGEAQVLPLNVPNKHKRLAQDLFNTLVECRWRYTLIVFLLSHFVSWFLFALVWYAMALAHGDMEETVREVGELPCLINVMDFTSAFIFSMESQTTIGYGTAYPSRDCPQAVVVLCFQSVCGMIIEAFSVGIVFAKLTRPHLRSQTLLFGRRAVVAVRDGCLTLMFRVGDIRKSELVSARLWVVVRGVGDGEDPDTDQTELAVTFNGNAKNLSMAWPATVMHRIDDKSPLYRFDPRDVQRDPFELLVFLEGTNQATGQTTQARTSYSQTDILWGHKLYPMLRFNKKHDRYEADYNRFHETIEVDTPLCSAQDLNRVRRLSELSVLHPITESREETSVDIEA